MPWKYCYPKTSILTVHFFSITCILTVAIVLAAVAEELYWVFIWELCKLNNFPIVMPLITLLLLIGTRFFFFFFQLLQLQPLDEKSKTLLTMFLLNDCITNIHMKLNSTLSSLCNSCLCYWIHISPLQPYQTGVFPSTLIFSRSPCKSLYFGAYHQG